MIYRHLSALALSLLLGISALSGQVNFSITLKDAFSADVTISAYQGAGLTPKDIDIKSTSNGKVEFKIPAQYLPGEFQVNLLYRKTEKDSPQGARLFVLLGKNDLAYTINPAYTQYDSINHGSDPENEALQAFRNESAKRKVDLPVLEQFLKSYGAKDTKFYASASREYNVLVADYNRWIDSEIKKSSALFASHLYSLEKLPTIDWSANANAIFDMQTQRFFDYIDLSDSLLLRSPALFNHMNKFIDLYIPRVTSAELADSILTEAGHIACEKASTGHPMVYGWMVDYFYIGFESLGMQQGMKMLEKHIQSPNCLTQKKIQIQRRLDGMQRLALGSKAPGFTLYTLDGNPFNLYQVVAPTPNLLLLFWSADCEHCLKLAAELKGFLEYGENSKQISVVAISLDETPAEVDIWQKQTLNFPDWVHLRAKEGLNSAVAYDYAILSTPVMFLISSSDYSILASPLSINELNKAIQD